MIAPTILCLTCSLVFGSETPLREAITNNDVVRVKELLERGENPNECYENRYSPIFFAENPQIAELLIAHGADLNRRTVFGDSPLENAAQEYHAAKSESQPLIKVIRVLTWLRIVQVLKRSGGKYTVPAAIFMNDVQEIENQLADDDSWVKQPHEMTEAPLRTAARSGHVEICKLLLEHQADPDDFARGCGYPILHNAINQPEIVKLLIEYGANLRRRITWRGLRTGLWIVGDEATALHFAVYEGNLESVKILVEAGLDVNATDLDGQTPLHLALRGRAWAASKNKNTQSFTKIVKYLLDNDASPRFLRKDPDTPLHVTDMPEEIQQLLQNRQAELDAEFDGGLEEDSDSGEKILQEADEKE